MYILKIIATAVGLIACAAIIVIAFLEVASRHMSMADLGSKILGYFVGIVIGACIVEGFITLIDWAYSIGHPWIALVFFGLVMICFFVIMRAESED